MADPTSAQSQISQLSPANASLREACSLYEIYYNTGDMACIDQAIRLLLDTLHFHTRESAERYRSLVGLGHCLCIRYDSQKSGEDLDQAILSYLEAVGLLDDFHTPNGEVFRLLGNALKRRFQKPPGSDTSLDEAIKHHRSGLALQTVGQGSHLQSLNDLASCLHLRFQKLKEKKDLDDLIKIHRTILDLHPEESADRAKATDELLLHLRNRGMVADLNDCITLGRSALERKPVDSDHSTCLRHLIIDIYNGFDELGRPSGLQGPSDHDTLRGNIENCIQYLVDEKFILMDMETTDGITDHARRLYPSSHLPFVVILTSRFRQNSPQRGATTYQENVTWDTEELQSLLPNSCGVLEDLSRIRAMYRALSDLPPAQFSVHDRGSVPCSVHHIETITFTQGHTDAATYAHCIQARGLHPVRIDLPQPLENISVTPIPYVLIRQWDPKFLDESVMTSDTSAYHWLTTMQQPFKAHLLKQLPQLVSQTHAQYTRVASSCHILACPTGPSGALDGTAVALAIMESLTSALGSSFNQPVQSLYNIF